MVVIVVAVSVTAVGLELEQQVSADVEGGVGKGVSTHARVAELPDTLERLELMDDLVDIDSAREVSLEERLRISEHGSSRLVVDLRLLERGDSGTGDVDLDAAGISDDCNDDLPLGGRLRAIGYSIKHRTFYDTGHERTSTYQSWS